MSMIPWFNFVMIAGSLALTWGIHELMHKQDTTRPTLYALGLGLMLWLAGAVIVCINPLPQAEPTNKCQS